VNIIHEYSSTIPNYRAGIFELSTNPTFEEISMRPIPFPVLTGDHQPHIVRAHRLRGAVAATLVRDLVRWISAAAR
jgi:hypothetical protein